MIQVVLTKAFIFNLKSCEFFEACKLFAKNGSATVDRPLKKRFFLNNITCVMFLQKKK